MLKDAQIKKFKLRIQLANLIEKNFKTISEYLDKANDLAVKLSFNDIDVEMTVLKEMKDDSKKKKMFFECNKDVNYFYDMIKKLIKAVYSKVEKINSFDLSYKKFMQISLRNSEIITTNELFRQILININAAFLTLLQKMRFFNTTVASDVSIAKLKITITASFSFSDRNQNQRKYKHQQRQVLYLRAERTLCQCSQKKERTEK